MGRSAAGKRKRRARGTASGIAERASAPVSGAVRRSSVSFQGGADAPLHASQLTTTAAAPGPLAWVLRHSFGVALVAALITTIVPLWCSRYLPMIDLPQHLLMMHIANHLDDPALPYREFFMERPGFTPYLAYYSVVRALSVAFPLEVANRVFLSVCAAGLPLACWWLLSSLGRNRWLALLACPFAYDFNFRYGFTSQAAGTVLMVACLAVYVTRLRGHARSLWWDLPLVLLPMACVTTHALPFFLFVGGLLVLCVAFPRFSISTGVRALPAAGLLATWILPAAGSEPPIGRLKTQSLLAHVEQFPEFAFAWFRGEGGYVALAVFIGLCAWAGALAYRAEAAVPARRAMFVLFAATVLAYLLLPWDLERILIVYPRFASLVCLAGILALPLPPVGLPAAFKAAIVFFCVGWNGYLVSQFQRADPTFGDLQALAERIEPRTCVATFRKYFPDSVLRGTAAHSHDAEYLALLTDSLPGYTFAYTPQSPLALRRPDGEQANGIEDARLPVVRGSTRQSEFDEFYRYFLVPARESARAVFGPYHSGMHVVGRSGPYVLYENPVGRCGR